MRIRKWASFLGRVRNGEMRGKKAQGLLSRQKQLWGVDCTLSQMQVSSCSSWGEWLAYGKMRCQLLKVLLVSLVFYFFLLVHVSNVMYTFVMGSSYNFDSFSCPPPRWHLEGHSICWRQRCDTENYVRELYLWLQMYLWLNWIGLGKTRPVKNKRLWRLKQGRFGHVMRILAQKAVNPVLSRSLSLWGWGSWDNYE